MFSNLLQETQLSLWARHLVPLFCFYARFFHSMVILPRLDLRGGIKAQYFAFLARFFPVYGYRAAIRPAGTALKPCIFFFKSFMD